MANDLSLPDTFGPLPSAFAGAAFSNDELGAGVASSYAVMGIKGKVWSVKFGGEEKQLLRDDGDGPRNSIEVVIVKASPAISKIFYKNGYVDGANAPPDCWSGNGVTPDTSVKEKMCATCADCPMNAWGSRTTDAGKQAKACADSRRIAVVPVSDLANEAFGGPMLLRVPAASLKDLKAYGDLLNQHQYPYYAAATRIAFDSNEAFPKFVLSAIRPLNEVEASVIKELREDKRVATVLAEKADTVGSGVASTVAAEVAKSPFEQTVTPEVTKPAEVKKATPVKPKATPAPKPAPAAKTPLDLAREALAAAEAEAKALEEASKPKVETPAEKVARLRAEAAAALAEAEAEAKSAESSSGSGSINALLAGMGEDEEGVEEETPGGAPQGFDELLEGIIGG